MTQSFLGVNRVVTWTSEGSEIEGDPQDLELVIIEAGMENCGGADSPAVQERQVEEEDDKKLKKDEATAFRGTTMRGGYYYQNRMEAKFCG